MSSKPFRFHPEAREEFRNAARWYRERRVIAAVEFRRTVSAAVRDVADRPQGWPKYLYGTHRFILQRFPFSVVYLDEQDIVTIIAVAHGKRKPGYWKERL